MKEILAKFGFSAILLIIGIILLALAVSTGQNTYVILGIITVVVCAILISLNNAQVIPVNITVILALIIMLGAAGFAYMDYQSVRRKIDFIAEQKRREVKVVKRLIDIRSAQFSYKKLYGNYAANFDELISHVKNDSMPVVKANGFVPDSLTEMQAVEMGIVTRDTILISVRDTLFPKQFHVDSLQYVPFSKGQKFTLEAGQIERNKLYVKVFEAFASYDKILAGLNLSEQYVDVTEGLRVGSMNDPHTRGNWE